MACVRCHSLPYFANCINVSSDLIYEETLVKQRQIKLLNSGSLNRFISNSYKFAVKTFGFNVFIGCEFF